jgi:hypothetical protein
VPSLTSWELWACANALIEQHGDDAAIFAAQRADALLEQTDLDGARTWRGIVRRINELQAKASGPLH